MRNTLIQGLVFGNADWRAFAPVEGNPDAFESPTGEFSTLARLSDATYVRSFVDGTEHHFTPAGRLDHISDRYGHLTSYTYESDLLTTITSPTGYFYKIEYTNGKLSRLVDSAGRETTFEIDAMGDLVSVTDAVGSQRTFAYDDSHVLVAQIRSRGERSEYVYENGRIVEADAYDVDGSTVLRTRTFAPSALKGEAGAALATGSGTIDNPIPIVEDRVDVFVDGRGETWLHETDLRGYLVRTVDPLERTTSYVVDDNGLTLQVVLPNGTTSEFAYDSEGNMTLIREMTEEEQITYSLEYNAAYSQLYRLVDPNGHETLYFYNSNGTLATIQDALENAALTLHYEDPQFPDLSTREVNALGHGTQTSYDSHGNPETITDALKRTTTFAYDSSGNMTAVIDARGLATQVTYSTLNQVLSIEDPLGNVTQFSYNASACGCDTAYPATLTYPDGTNVTFAYDGLGRRTEYVDQLGKMISWEYDPENNVLTFTNRNGEQMSYNYDAARQFIRKELPGSDVTSFFYDLAGNMVIAVNATSQLDLTYDGFSRLTQVATHHFQPVATVEPYLLSYSYDAAGNRVSMTLSTGAVDYLYDELDRLLNLTSNQGPIWDFSYDALGRRTEITSSNGVTTTYTYDEANQMTSITRETEDNPQLLTTTYDAYDADGNSTQETVSYGEEAIAITYAFEELNRLEESTRPAPDGGKPVDLTYQYDDASRLLQDDEFDYTYDDEGRLITQQERESCVTTTYEYDAEDRLRELAVLVGPDEPVSVLNAHYYYDPFGRRIAKVVNDVTTRYVYDNSALVLELDKAGLVLREFTHGPRGPLGLRDLTTSAEYYYHTDRLGSVLMLTDSLGTAAQTYAYDDFGNLIATSLGGGPRGIGSGLYDPIFLYKGGQHDEESGLYWDLDSLYSPLSSRYNVEGQIHFAAVGMNLYSYANNNPVNFGSFEQEDPVEEVKKIIDRVKRLRKGIAGEKQSREEQEKYYDELHDLLDELVEYPALCGIALKAKCDGLLIADLDRCEHPSGKAWTFDRASCIVDAILDPE